MVGAVVAEYQERIPPFLIHLALKAPIEIVFPTAPAEGLILVDAGLGSMRRLSIVSESRIMSWF